MKPEILISSAILALISCIFFLTIKNSTDIRGNDQYGITSRARDELHKADIIHLSDAVGPESVAFDRHGQGPYVGVGDGRILRWDGKEKGWDEFGFTSPYWNKEKCMQKGSVKLEHVCGRPLGLQFHMATGDLYVADSYFGLMVIGEEGGLATPLVTEAEGESFKFTNNLDIDQERGIVYFTDSSNVYQRRQFPKLVMSGDQTGRLMSYNTKTQQVKVLLKRIAFANGVTLSKDRSFVLVVKTSSCRILKLWLEGSNEGKIEKFATNLPGFPDNVRRNSKGEFWVAIHARKGLLTDILRQNNMVRSVILKLQLELLQYLREVFMAKKSHALAIKLGEDGDVLDVLEDRNGRKLKDISEVHELNGSLWIGSISMPYVALYKLYSK